MKVYTGNFRYIQDGEIETIVATTVERIERELVRMMSNYVEWVNDCDGEEIPTDFDHAITSNCQADNTPIPPSNHLIL